MQAAATSPASGAFLAEVGLAAAEERLVSLALAVRLVAVRGMHPRRLGESVPGLAGLLVESRVMERVVAVDGDRLLDEAFDGLELVALLRRHERDRRARLARARRASNAVDV